MRIVFSVLLALLPLSAWAGLDFCNSTDEKLNLAIGYNGAEGWTSEGWWGLEPGACKTVEGKALDKRYYYYRAEGATLTWSTDSYFFCTGSSPLTIVGDTNCAERGYAREGFKEIELDEGVTEFTMTLNAAAPTESPKSVEESELYTVQGLLSHCDVTDAGTQCELHSDWQRIISYVPFDGDMRVHDVLMDLPPNTPMLWEGRVTVADAGYAEVDLTRVQQQGSDPYADTRFGIQGAWVSDDDSQYLLVIYGGVFEELYEGVPTETAMLDIVGQCGSEIHPDNLVLEVRSFGAPDGEPRCLEILHYDDHSLELWPQGAMRPLSFSANGM